MDIETFASMLEAWQAERDYSAAFEAFIESGARAGSPQDYALWSAGGYFDAAQAASLL
jgi:hypothetical protein